MFDRLRIRSKLIVLLAAPLVALLVLAGIVGVGRRADADETRNDRHLFEVAALAADAAHEVQVETELAARYAASRDDADGDRWRAQTAVSDRALSAARAELATLDADQFDRPTRASLNLLTETVDNPDRARATVTGQITEWPVVLIPYGNISDSFAELSLRLANSTRRPELNAEARSWSLAVQIEDDIAEQRAVLTGAFTDGRFTRPESLSALAEIVDREEADVATSEAFAVPKVRDDIRTALSGNAVSTADDLRQTALEGGDDPLGVSVEDWRAASGEKLDRIRGAELAAATSVFRRADELAAAAERSARLFIIGALVAVLAAIALAALVARRITRPLVRLTHAADSLATEQLPRMVESLRNPAEDDVSHLASSLTPIEVRGNDEIGQLAKSFNSVQTVAVDVAIEQAALLRKGIGDMFVNLARRNQTLLDRQIEFLDRLEADEQNPDQLDNLFKLDHMATRMRRNAESLLVLAGAEPTRRRGRPIPLADVVRAALGEVEDFNRIDLLSFDEVLLQSNAASDMAHLLSELMENATNFSPPDTRVEVVGHRGPGGGYVVSVTDRGIGMTVEQIAEHNALLAQPPLVGLSLSRSLGFIVIGRLAARYGISVRVMPVPSGGLTAVVTLPAALVTDPAGADVAPSEPIADLTTPRPTSGATAASAGAEPFEPTPSTSDGGRAEPTTVHHDDDELVPSLGDAVPVGSAFDEGLAAMVDHTHVVPDGRPEAAMTDGAAPAADCASPAHPSNNGTRAAATPVTATPVTATPVTATPVTAGPAQPLVEPLPDGEPPSPVESVPAPAPVTATTTPASVEAHQRHPEPDRRSESLPGEPPSAPMAGTSIFGPRAQPEPPRPQPTSRSVDPGPNRGPDVTEGRDRHLADSPSAEPVPAEEATVLPSGLPKRKAGGSRPKPGGDVAGRGVTKAKRSPEEIRRMLSSYRGGVQRGQSADLADADTADTAGSVGSADIDTDGAGEQP